MRDHGVFWKLEALSDRQLLERLASVLGSSRRLMAELIAHLGEVEERRLHLAAACSSMFTYCLKLGMTEDEAYRRIEVARLARRYPAIFPLLANGQVSLSVVALLRHHLSEENHLELLTAVTGKSVAQARELIAARFPRPDVPSSVRKLPERRVMTEPSLALSTPPEACASGAASSSGVTAPLAADVATPSTGVTERQAGVTAPRRGVVEPRFAADVTTPRTSEPARFTSNVTSATEVPASAATADVARRGRSMAFIPAVNATDAPAPEKLAPTDAQRAAPPPDAQRVAPPLPPDAQRVAPPSRIEPLSAQRYKVQFTGSAELARKLALAKDLMRHSQPGGELGPIVERALDLLIESLMRRRFGKKASPKRRSAGPRSTDAESRSDVMSDRSTMRGAAEPSTTLVQAPTHHTPTRDTAEPTTSTTPESAPAESARPDSAPPDSTPSAVVTVECAPPGPAPLESAPPAVAPPECAPAESARPDSAPPDSTSPAVVTVECAPPASADLQVDRRGALTRASVSPYIPRSTRRAVVERDGLGCSWVDEHGARCGARAWLEYDHRHPRAKGGGSEPDNVRLLCRSHNRFAAERAYGREHVERTIAERQRDEHCT